MEKTQNSKRKSRLVLDKQLLTTAVSSRGNHEIFTGVIARDGEHEIVGKLCRRCGTYRANCVLERKDRAARARRSMLRTQQVLDLPVTMITLTLPVLSEEEVREGYWLLRRGIKFVQWVWGLSGYWAIECVEKPHDQLYAHAHLLGQGDHQIDAKCLGMLSRLAGIGSVADASRPHGRLARQAICYIASFSPGKRTTIPWQWRGLRLWGAFGFASNVSRARRWKMQTSGPVRRASRLLTDLEQVVAAEERCKAPIDYADRKPY